MRSVRVLKFDRSPSTVNRLGRSSRENPAQAVAQNTKLCSLDIDSTLPASISVGEPSSPCP